MPFAYSKKHNSFGNFYNNYTYCELCDEKNDFEKCAYIVYSDEYGCSDIEVYYFIEKNEFFFVKHSMNFFINY